MKYDHHDEVSCFKCWIVNLQNLQPFDGCLHRKSIGGYSIYVKPHSCLNAIPKYIKIFKELIYRIMRLSPLRFQLPWVMADKISRYGFITISYADQHQIKVPIVSILFNPSTLKTHTWRIFLMLSVTLVSLIACIFGNIKISPLFDPSSICSQLVVFNIQHAIIQKMLIS